jgi:hypothetical protein
MGLGGMEENGNGKSPGAGARSGIDPSEFTTNFPVTLTLLPRHFRQKQGANFVLSNKNLKLMHAKC